VILEFGDLNQRESQLGYYMIRFRSADEIFIHKQTEQTADGLESVL